VSAGLWTSSIVSTCGLGGLAVVTLRSAGPRPGPLVVAGLASVVLAVVLLDLPRETVLDAEGVRRRCLLRDQRIAWASVVAVERLRPRMLRPGGRRGLVLRGRRGRWLLTDRTEPPADHDRLRRFVTDVAPSVRWDVPAPEWSRE
jgi:hypothetical protein